MGWERDKSALLIAAMIEGIKLGHRFPAANTFLADGKFYLMFRGGGAYHRAIAHYIKGAPLRCNLFSNECADVMDSGRKWILVQDINFAGYFCEFGTMMHESEKYQSQISDALSYLPGDIAENFCQKNNLDPRCFLAQ
jgi:hypothetical protein